MELAIGLAEQGIKFDSIMVDASHADVGYVPTLDSVSGSKTKAYAIFLFVQTDEENIAISKPFIDRCHALGISTEVELGRLEGGEAGLREITGGMLTNPDNAEHFISG